jgi:hypothetical protein
LHRKCIFIRLFAENPQIIDLKCNGKHFSDVTGGETVQVCGITQQGTPPFAYKLARRGVKHGERSNSNDRKKEE